LYRCSNHVTDEPVYRGPATSLHVCHQYFNVSRVNLCYSMMGIDFVYYE